MNNASEHDIDRVLTALRDTQPTEGMERRILHAMEHRTPARSSWFRWTLSSQWSLAAFATATIVLAIALTTHNTQQPTPTIAQIWGDPSLPDASSPAKVGLHNAPTPNLSSRPQAAHFAAAAETPAIGTANTPTPNTRHPGSVPPTYPPHQLLCDCDPIAMAEMQAPSQLAPEMPLTSQERLLQRVVHRGDPIEIAELEPIQSHALRAAPAPKEDDAVRSVVQHFLKQLAAAEALDPTAPTPTPAPPPASDSNDPGPDIDSLDTPN
jgi:hypothetical protein